MAPKAKVRVMRPAAAAKAKVRLRRPAAAGAPPMRRPARSEDPGEADGVRRVLSDLSVAELSRLTYIWAKRALYYHQEVEVVGKVEGVRAQDGQIYLDMDATGTKSESLLKAISGKQGRRISLHVCPAGCEGKITDEFLLHGKEFEEVDIKGQDWYSNLVLVAPREEQEADELQGLRTEGDKRRGEQEGRLAKSPKKKKKEKKKKEKVDKDVKEREKSKRREASSESEDLEIGQKGLEALFSGTGLDPSPRARRKVLKKARRMGRSKKKKKRSSSGSSSSSSSSSKSSSSKEISGGLFNSEKKMKKIWRRYPGSLAATALMEARQSLLTVSGVLWDVDKNALPPITTQYTRQHLAPAMSPPMLQEALTISACLDGLLQGRVAWTADILAQRLKSLESSSRGTHWSIGRQLELIRAEPQGITGEAEGLSAARAAREEERLRSTMGRSSTGRPSDFGSASKGKKGKEGKGTGKQGADESSRGKGGGGKKEGKSEWQKKDK